MAIQSLVVVFLIGMLSSFSSVADGQKPQGLNLPADIKPLFTKEMLAIEQGMKDLLSSIAKGEWDKTAAIGKQIQASYIMKQSLTQEQKKLLHSSLPDQFIRQDRDFHKYAGMLSHAAKAKNADITNFYFYKMTESCIQCHSRYATERFPALARPVADHSHHTHKH